MTGKPNTSYKQVFVGWEVGIFADIRPGSVYKFQKAEGGNFCSAVILSRKVLWAPELVAPTANPPPGFTFCPRAGEGSEVAYTCPIFLQGLSRTWHLAQISYFDGWLILASKFPECWKSFQEEGVNRFTGGSKTFIGFVLHSWLCFSRVDANLLSVKTKYRTKRVRLRNTYKLWNLKILVIVKSCSSTLVSLEAFSCYW